MEGLNSISRVTDNDVGSKNGRQVCEKLPPSRSGQSGTSLLALRILLNLRPGSILIGIFNGG